MKKILAIIVFMVFITIPISTAMVCAEDGGLGEPGTNFQNNLSQEEWEALLLQMNLHFNGNGTENNGHDVSYGSGYSITIP